MSATKRVKGKVIAEGPARVRGAAAGRERAVQRSVSLRPSQWQLLDRFGVLTDWGRNGALAQAVDLYTTLPLPTVQRIATLRHTTLGARLRERIQGSVEEALNATEAELADDPFAEFDVMLADAADAFVRSGAAEMSMKQLTAAAEEGKRASRKRRLGGSRAAGER